MAEERKWHRGKRKGRSSERGEETRRREREAEEGQWNKRRKERYSTGATAETDASIPAFDLVRNQ